MIKIHAQEGIRSPWNSLALTVAFDSCLFDTRESWVLKPSAVHAGELIAEAGPAVKDRPTRSASLHEFGIQQHLEVATHRSQDVAGQRDELTRASGLGKHLPTPLAVLAVCVASVGYSASLLLQDRLIALTPDDLRGHALGLHTSGMLAMQAVGATIAGLVAGHVSPASAMTIMALASVVTTVALTPRLLRRKHSHAR
jgi:hypothetical protein